MKDIEVKKIRTALGFTQEEFAKKLGVHYRSVQKWESGETKIRPANAFLIRDMYEKHSSGADENKVVNSNGNSFYKIDNGMYIMQIPLIEVDAQAGFADKYQDVEFLAGIDNFHTIMVSEVHKGRYMAFRVNGDSMDSGKSDAILPNYIVTVRELNRSHWKEKLKFNKFPYWVVATTESNYPLLKEITNHDTEKGVITCHSLNTGPEYKDFELNLDSVQSLFYVIDINRNIANSSY